MDQSEEIVPEIQDLVGAQRTLHLATRAPSGEPEASYAPFIVDEGGNFYIFVSRLSRHTRNLLEQPGLSVLLIEPEAKAQQIFARKRLSYHCVAEVIARDDPEWTARLNQFEARFGAIIEMLRSLDDFVLFRLVPKHGSFVKGFGQAYTIDSDMIEHVSPERIKRGDTID
ncbi:MAG: pyridoxamine 5'-phosphate oxidase family protein [Pseudomonadota bacterium]